MVMVPAQIWLGEPKRADTDRDDLGVIETELMSSDHEWRKCIGAKYPNSGQPGLTIDWTALGRELIGKPECVVLAG
jgi:hypothetical protein